jgi:putative ATPase
MAVDAALDDVRRGLAGPVPSYLRDAHYRGAQQIGHGRGYRYPHDEPGGVAAQQYAPDAVAARTYYKPTRYGAEARLADLWDKLRALIRGS